MNSNFLFIAFEGLDGSGKDTQLLQLIDLIKSSSNNLFGDKYSNIWVTRQPTKITQAGVEISHKIKQEHVSKEEATRGFIQDRIEHSQIIKTMLHHSYVLTSRCDFSTLVYQSAQGMDLEELYEMHKYDDINGTLIPHITLLFKVSPEVGLKRISSTRQDVPVEYFENYDFLKKCQRKEQVVIEYLKEKDGRCIIEINAEQNIEAVTQEMLEKLEEWHNNNDSH
ncbi:MAG: dTMP kinase [Candidatus Nanoarchaeia archaeon]